MIIGDHCRVRENGLVVEIIVTCVQIVGRGRRRCRDFFHTDDLGDSVRDSDIRSVCFLLLEYLGDLLKDWLRS